MASKFFRGFSRVFKGPSDRTGFGTGKKFATIGGVKPKTILSEATKKFKQKVKAIDKGLRKGIEDFKSENPNRNVTDDQISKIRKDKKKEMVQKKTKAFLRDKKRKGGRIGFKKGTGKSGVPAMDIKSTPTKKLSEKQELELKVQKEMLELQQKEVQFEKEMALKEMQLAQKTQNDNDKSRS